MIKKWISDILQFLFPRYCWLCGVRLLKGEEHICLDCMQQLPRTQLHLVPHNEMEKLFWGLVPLQGSTAFFYYHRDDIASHVIYHLKYYGHPQVGEYLAACAAREIQQTSRFWDGIDYIVPVPLHPKRLRKRGYNQCDYIARGVSQVTDIPIRPNALQRIRSNNSQTTKGRVGRQESVQTLFELNRVEGLQNKHLLVVDDVCTTGSTLTAVLTVLLQIQGVKLSVFTLSLANDLH